MYMLNVLDQKDKSWGFYKMPDLSGKEPVKIYMGPYYFGGDGLRIMRAENAEVFFLEREAVAEAKCFVATKDFKNFTKLSDVSPEKQYNWMTASLVKWTTPAGRPCEGVLYKPQDFDPSKKYPVVLTVYNQYSSQLNAYMEPNEWSERNGYGNFLPSCWLISNGYLVLIPDVNRRTVGKRLQDSRDIVVAGVEHLSTLPYVDIKHVGIQGTSWGGEQTNYIISHTPVFAAAFSGAGFSERMSSSGFSDAVNQGHNMMHNEFVLGGVLTEVPERYIAETALFSSDKVVTPVLFKHNKDDDAVPFYQSLQYFRLLRRLGKKAWLLQYENGGHGIREGKYNEDLMTRVSQFFNHFLKGAPAPVWLTNDITPESKK
jgi:dipeptidyl aminopeptidase/acylaminoacyl peptidase